jgi:prepilin-type N-terminal cleavage/methylation domain-containing protein
VTRQEGGFTLIEVLVTLVIAATVLSAIGSLLALVARHTERSALAEADVQETIAFTRLVDRLLADVGPDPDAVVADRQSLTVAGFGAPRGLAAAGEAVIRLERQPAAAGRSQLAFTVLRVEGDGGEDDASETGSATFGRSEIVLTDLEAFEILAARGGHGAGGAGSAAGPVSRIRFAWLRRGGRPRIHDVEVHRATRTACVRGSLARGCSLLSL